MIREERQSFSAVMPLEQEQRTTRTASSTWQENVERRHPPRLSREWPWLDEVRHDGLGRMAHDWYNHRLLRRRYQLLDQVGKGGFGTIYKAIDTSLGNRLVAIKEVSERSVPPQKLREASAALKREAFMLASIVHPNIPRIYDFFSEGESLYLVMDYIEGETLEAYLYRIGGKLPFEHAVQFGIRLCTILAYLHTRQEPIIYRDLKPSNIMLTPEGHLYLIDFGIARTFKLGQEKDTAAFGTPGYTAPEQFGREQTTPGSDIYSLGALLHLLLTGDDPTEAPFHFAPLQLGYASYTIELEKLIGQMLAMDANRRPVSMRVVKQKLQQIAAEQTRQARAIARAVRSHKKPIPLAADRRVSVREAVLIFLSGSVFAGITAYLLGALGSM